MRGPVVGVAAALVVLAGCSSDVSAADAAAAALAFARADPSEACQLLAPETAARVVEEGGCAATLASLDLPPASDVQQVEVAGESAQVRLADQVIFLARFPGGWRVTAAGCVRDDPDPAVPYVCEVQP